MGNPTDNWKEDVEGKPESGAMKAVRGAAKMGAKATSKVAKNSGLDDKYTDVAVRAADLVEQQADADVHTSLKDRAKLGGMYKCNAYITTKASLTWARSLELRTY